MILRVKRRICERGFYSVSMRIPEEFLSLLRQKVDIVDVVSEYVRLKRVGRSLVGLCPFHSERTPSFHVTPEKGFYHCFGCGAGGTAITFVMEIEQLTFVQAIERLAEKSGLPIPKMEDDLLESEDRKLRAQLYEVNALATKLYNHILMNHPAGAQGLSYLLERGLTKKTIAQFQLGYSPANGRDLVQFLRKRGFSVDLIVQAGLGLISSDGELFDRFRNRVMFPIADLQGRTIGFGARTLTGDDPKYINTQETPIFRKGNILYGYALARQGIRKTGKAVLLEGYMDVIALHQHGITHAIASLGTALTTEQAAILRRAVADEVILLYDGDSAGQKATQKSIEILRDMDIPIRVAQMPQDVDPDEAIRKQGVDAFRSDVLDKAVSALEYQLIQLTHKHPQHMTTDRIDYLRDAISILALEESSIEREAMAEWLSKTYAISLAALKDDLNTQVRLKSQRKETNVRVKKWDTSSHVHIDHGSNKTGSDLGERIPLKHIVAERQLLVYMLLDSDVVKQVQMSVHSEFSLPLHSALQAYVYTFYAEHEHADPELLLASIDDPAVLQFAAKLLHEAVSLLEPGKLPDPQGVRDYIQCLIGYELERDMQRVSEALKHAIEQGDTSAMNQSQEELWRLRAALVQSNQAAGSTQAPIFGRRSGR